MESYRNVIVLTCVTLYMVLCLVVGLWALRRTHTTRDFFMAGRNLGFFVTGIAVFSSTMSGFGFVGGPGLVYRMGTSSFYMVLCSTISIPISTYLLGKRLRLFAELRESISLPDAVAARYRSETSRLLTATAILLGVLGYLAAQILAMAVVLKELLAPTNLVNQLPVSPLEACVIISVAVMVFYCITGGIIASVYTDVFQGVIMLAGSILVFFAAMNAVQGGFAGMSQTLLKDDPESIGPWGTVGMLGCLSWYFLFAVGGCGQPHVITKLMMTRKVEDTRSLLPVTVIAYGIAALLWISIGLAMRTLVIQGEHPELPKPDAAAPQFLQTYAHPLLAGVIFAGLFAAIMSTADSFLNIGAAAIVHDIPQALKGRSLPHELFWARTATLLLAVVASLLALYSGDLVALLGAFGWGTFAAAIVPTVAIGFNWKRATPLAANTAIVASLLVNFAVKLLNISIPYGISTGFLALLVSLLLFFGISLLSPPPRLEPDINAVMDL